MRMLCKICYCLQPIIYTEEYHRIIECVAPQPPSYILSYYYSGEEIIFRIGKT